MLDDGLPALHLVILTQNAAIRVMGPFLLVLCYNIIHISDISLVYIYLYIPGIHISDILPGILYIWLFASQHFVTVSAQWIHYGCEYGALT